MPKSIYMLSSDYKYIIRGTLAIIEDAKKERDEQEYIYYAIRNACDALETILEDMEAQDNDI